MNVTGTLRFAFLGLLALDRTMSYDYENRMIRISENGTTAAFAYNPRGERIMKTVNGVTTYYFFGNYEEVIAGSETTTIKYYFGPNGRIAQRKINGTEDELLYISTDHLGSAVRMTDANGEIVQSIAYDPFGKTVYSAGAKEPGYQFTGQEKDAGTGLYYYDSRYYDPELGKFLQADTILSSLNRYAYCGNNPINYIDPSGHVTEASNYADSSWGAHMAPGDTVTYNTSGADANHSWSYSSTVTIGSGGYTMQSTGTITTYGEPGDPTHTSTVTNTRDYLSDSTNVASEPPSDVPEQDNKPKDDSSFLDAWNFHVGNFNIAFSKAVSQITNADFGVDFLRQKEGYRQKGDYFNYFLCDVNCILEGTIDYLAIYFVAEAAGWLVTNVSGLFAGGGGGTNIITSGKPHGTTTHWNKIQTIVTDLVKSGKYSDIYINKSLSTSGLSNSLQRPDIIAIGINCQNILIEIVSPSQTVIGLQTKITGMLQGLSNTTGQVIVP